MVVELQLEQQCMCISPVCWQALPAIILHPQIDCIYLAACSGRLGMYAFCPLFPAWMVQLSSMLCVDG